MNSDHPFWNHIGLTEVFKKDGLSKIELEVTGLLTQRHGTVHGGVLATMVDAAVGTSIRSLLPEKKAAVTVEMKVNYLRPSTGSKLIGEGRIINKGQSIIVGEAQIKNEDGKVVAHGTATYMIVK
ncbi:PaaI family thioesterase [Halobacillus sp. A5]|uniref:PaaI family thioesterase n=1 Tax=Halobacillus sp. A5 TaxID=2880263 RepID=UPI0020A6DA88|nr:PaaI family thioesterase [Halobacillus sp. A5]